MVIGDNVGASFVVALVSPFTLRDTVEVVDFKLAETISRACWWQQARLPMYRYQIAMRIGDCDFVRVRISPSPLKYPLSHPMLLSASETHLVRRLTCCGHFHLIFHYLWVGGSRQKTFFCDVFLLEMEFRGPRLSMVRSAIWPKGKHQARGRMWRSGSPLPCVARDAPYRVSFHLPKEEY